MADVVPRLDIRVELGNPDPDEIAALVAVLLTRVSTVTHPRADKGSPPRAMTSWWPPQPQPGFLGPRSWRAGRPRACWDGWLETWLGTGPLAGACARVDEWRFAPR